MQFAICKITYINLIVNCINIGIKLIWQTNVIDLEQRKLISKRYIQIEENSCGEYHVFN